VLASLVHPVAGQLLIEGADFKRKNDCEGDVVNFDLCVSEAVCVDEC